MSFPHAVAVNNAAVDLLRRNQSAEAMVLLESAWASLGANTPTRTIDELTILPSPPPHDAQVREVLQHPPHLIPTLHGESLAFNQNLTLESIDVEHQASSEAPPQEFPALGFSTLPAMMRLTVCPVDVVIQSVPIDDSTNAVVTILEDMDHKISPGNYFTIYKRAFRLDNHGREMDLLGWLRCVPHIPAVVLYNTGLVFHRLAMQNGSSASFQKALELYQLSMIILESNAKNGFYVSELDILMLALTNNMGHCHSHFHHMEDAWLCLQRMCKVFLLSVSTVLFSQEEYEFFYRVILLGAHRTPVLAPAA